jgi:hypothetical protein
MPNWKLWCFVFLGSWLLAYWGTAGPPFGAQDLQPALAAQR